MAQTRRARIQSRQAGKGGMTEPDERFGMQLTHPLAAEVETCANLAVEGNAASC